MTAPATRSLRDVVDSAAGARLLRTLARASAALSARELAQSTGVSEAQVFARLKELHHHGLVVRKDGARYALASPAWRAALRREDDLLRLWALPAPIVSQVLAVVRALRDWTPPPLAVVLTGSLAEGKFEHGSDIDLIAILQEEPKERGPLPGESEPDRQRGPVAPLRLTAPTSGEFEAELGRKDAFFTEALRDGLILYDREYLAGLQQLSGGLDSAALPWHELASWYERARGAAERGSPYGHETVQTFMTQLARAVLVAVGESPGSRPMLRRQLHIFAPYDVITAYESFVEGMPDLRFPPPLHLDLAWWCFESVARHSHILRPLRAELFGDRLRSIRAGTQRFFQDVVGAQVSARDGGRLMAERDAQQLEIRFDEKDATADPLGPPVLTVLPVLDFRAEASSALRWTRSVDLFWLALEHFASPAEQFGGQRPPFENEASMADSIRDGEKALWQHMRTHQGRLEGPRPVRITSLAVDAE